MLNNKLHELKIMVNGSRYFDNKDFDKLFVVFNEAIRLYSKELTTEYLHWAMFSIYANSKHEIELAQAKYDPNFKG
jgi:hypothetical protein